MARQFQDFAIMYYTKIHRRGGSTVLAVCDSDSHNKTFEDGDIRLFVDPSFYGKKETGEEELLELLKDVNIINLAGKGCVDLAISEGHVDAKSVIDIGGCLHAQVYRI